MRHRRFTPWLAVLLAVLLLLAQAVPVQAQTQDKNTPNKPGAARKGGRGSAAAGQRTVKQIETAMGKPLTAAQKKSIIAAVQERDKAMKPIRDRYRARVAKTLGITVEQLAAKERAYRAAQAKKSAAAARR